MALSTQEYIARLRLIHQEFEQLSQTGTLPPIDDQQLRRVLQYAFHTVPEFEPCWNDLSMWMNTVATFLEHYHTLASELLEEEDTIKLHIFHATMDPGESPS